MLHEFVQVGDPHEGDQLLEVGGSSHTQGAWPATPMVATPGDEFAAAQSRPGRRARSVQLDRTTHLEGRVSYEESFEPAIAPFKRVASFDAVRVTSDAGAPSLVVHDSSRQHVALAGPTATDRTARDRFAGEVALDFSEGRIVPLPSVAAETRIISLRPEPPVRLSVLRDSADNLFVELLGPAPDAIVQLSLVMDAPASYFGGPIPVAPLTTLAGQVPPLDPRVRQRALGFARELGIAPDADLRSALSALVAHFRAFEPSDAPPPDHGELYLDLARAKKGICRHRAYAFVITAQALGIPARFVENEAHSFVEVKLPQLGYRRIDLGGAPEGLEVHGLAGRHFHRPALADDLPRPPAYQHSAALARLGAERAGDEEAIGRVVADAEPPSAADPLALMRELAGHADARSGVHIFVREPDHEVMRGERLRVAGRVVDEVGAPAASLRVVVLLANERRHEHLLLGSAVTNSAGVFDARFDVPEQLEVGPYRLRVETRGDARFRPGRASP